MSLKKTLTALATAALLSLSVAVFSGCSAESAESEEEGMIRESLSAELESIKTVDDSFVTQMTSGMNADVLEMYGVGTGEFLAAYFDGFDYSVDSVSINDEGTRAEAVVTLTCRNFGAYANALSENKEALSGASEGGSDALEKAVMDAIASVEPAKVGPITIVYEKVDNVWTPAAESEGAIASALLAG